MSRAGQFIVVALVTVAGAAIAAAGMFRGNERVLYPPAVQSVSTSTMGGMSSASLSKIDAYTWKDAHRVYMVAPRRDLDSDTCRMATTAIDDADPKTFVPLSPRLLHYQGPDQLPGKFDPSGAIDFDYNYYKDRRHVYYFRPSFEDYCSYNPVIAAIDNADAASFRLLAGTTAADAEDAHFTYLTGQIVASAATSSETLPVEIGHCAETIIAGAGPRLDGDLESGSYIQYTNNANQVSYEVESGITHSKIGDRVRLCLVSIPINCPAGDYRGRAYSAFNERTGESWTLPDSQHGCGGA